MIRNKEYRITPAPPLSVAQRRLFATALAISNLGSESTLPTLAERTGRRAPAAGAWHPHRRVGMSDEQWLNEISDWLVAWWLNEAGGEMEAQSRAQVEVAEWRESLESETMLNAHFTYNRRIYGWCTFECGFPGS